MRITFVLPTVSMAGGIRVVSMYADRLHRRGHAVTVVTVPEQRPPMRAYLRAMLGRGRWPTYRAQPASYFDKLAVDYRLAPHPKPVVDADLPDADVVIATWWETAEWVYALSPSKGAKVHFVQGHEVFCGLGRRVEDAYRLPLAKITISQWLADILRRNYGAMQVALVPNAVEQERFYAPPRDKQPVPTVGFIYSPQPIKAIEVATEACRLARQRVPDLRVRACGSAPVNPAKPLPADTDFALQADDATLRRYYSGCDAWLFSTREEGFGLPIIEAMACRTPVIATPAGAAPELLAQGGGELVEQGNPASMAEAIVRLAALPKAQWRELSAQAWRNVAGYTLDDATDQFAAALTQAIENGAGLPRDRQESVL